jgi:hypothetical protein
MTRSDTNGITVPTFFLDVQCPVFQYDDNSQEACFLQDYGTSFDILVSLPPFVLFLIISL